MSSTTFCDKCRAKKTEKTQGWAGISLRGDLEEYGFPFLASFDLCSACSKRLLPTIQKFFKVKK